jgi:hypothetical protein
MPHNPIRTVIPASLLALAAVFVPQASHADDCAAAPTGAAPKGQHWYYHLDKTTQKKCWYLHDTLLRSSVKSAAPTAKRAASPQPASNASAQPASAPNAEATASRAEQATGTITAPAESTQAAAPAQPAAEPPPAQDATTVWSAPPPPAPANVVDAESAQSAVANTTDTPSAVKPEASAQPKTALVTAATPDARPANSVVYDLLIIGFAAALAGAVSVGFTMLRRRKRTRVKAANMLTRVTALADTASAKLAALRPRKQAGAEPANFLSRFDADFEGDSAAARPWARGKTETQRSALIQTSLVPEQVTMARPFVAPRWQQRASRDQRAGMK